MTRPLAHILVKPAGPDCNVMCDYCFYRQNSRLFPESTVHRMSDAVLEETIRQALGGPSPEFSFSWQGGEPTLMGVDFFRRAVELQSRHGGGKTVGNGLQTNGMLINIEWADFLERSRFLVGLSIDGPARIHDRYRRLTGGAGTADEAVGAARMLLDCGVPVNALSVVTDYSSRFAGEIYDYLRGIGLSHMQFIPCLEADPAAPGRAAPFSVGAEDYGRFLCGLFDLWMADFRDGTPVTSVRFFESLLFSMAGFAPPECSLMEECGAYLVVEHNGDVYPCDYFVEPSLRLGNVREGRLADMLNSPAMDRFASSKKRLPPSCVECQWLALCRGGCVKDRVRLDGPGGANHFCASYRMFFAHAVPGLKKLVDHWRGGREATAGPGHSGT